MKHVVVISDGNAGHRRQSLAVVERLKRFINVYDYEYTVRYARFRAYLLRFLLGTVLGRAFLRLLPKNRVLRFFLPAYDTAFIPDIVVSSGKKTAGLTALLGLLYGSTTWYVGNPKKLSKRFTRVLTVLDLGLANQVVLDTAPTFTLQTIGDEWYRRYGLCKEATYAVLLIGGNGAGYRYQESDIRKLVAFVNRTSLEIRWLVTTSRRTNPNFVSYMQHHMKAALFVAFEHSPSHLVEEFLEVGSMIFVTEDSASMVSEAVASQKPVVTVRPQAANPELNYRNILDKFHQEQRIIRYGIDELERLRISDIKRKDFVLSPVNQALDALCRKERK